MLGKFKAKKLWIAPLLAHVGVHGLFTLVISFFFVSWWLAFVLAFIDMLIHFTMDRLKASPDLLGKFKVLSGKDFEEIESKNKKLTDEMYAALESTAALPPGEILKKVHNRSYHLVSSVRAKSHNKIFWIALGFDQLIHHLTDLLIVYIIATH
jgi:ABC-type multidrug transport system fused ATPase/permease subunit